MSFETFIYAIVCCWNLRKFNCQDLANVTKTVRVHDMLYATCMLRCMLNIITNNWHGFFLSLFFLRSLFPPFFSRGKFEFLIHFHVMISDRFIFFFFFFSRFFSFTFRTKLKLSLKMQVMRHISFAWLLCTCLIGYSHTASLSLLMPTTSRLSANEQRSRSSHIISSSKYYDNILWKIQQNANVAEPEQNTYTHANKKCNRATDIVQLEHLKHFRQIICKCLKCNSPS